MKKLFILSFLSMIFIMFYTCKGEDGEDGNANVRSHSYSVPISSFAYYGSCEYAYAGAYLNAVIYDMVTVYINIPSSSYWRALPFTVYDANLRTTETFFYDISAYKTIDFIYQNDNCNFPYISGNFAFMVIVTDNPSYKSYPEKFDNKHELLKYYGLY